MERGESSASLTNLTGFKKSLSTWIYGKNLMPRRTAMLEDQKSPFLLPGRLSFSYYRLAGNVQPILRPGRRLTGDPIGHSPRQIGGQRHSDPSCQALWVLEGHFEFSVAGLSKKIPITSSSPPKGADRLRLTPLQDFCLSPAL